MYNDYLYILSKLFCKSPYVYSNKIFKPDSSASYRIRFYILLIMFCFLSIYIRIISSIKKFLLENGEITLQNYIYLASAAITILLICIQLLRKMRKRTKFTNLLNAIISVTPQNTLVTIRMVQFLFLIFIIILLLYINVQLHKNTWFLIGSFLGETFIEMISFLEVFEYFNDTYALYRTLSQFYTKSCKFGMSNEDWRFYLKLCEICRKISRLRSLNVTALVAFIFIWTMFDAYVFFHILVSGEYTNWKDFIRCAPWVILHTLKLAILVAVPPLCKTMVKNIKPLIFNEKNNWRQKEVNKYAFQAINFKVVFCSVWAWFEIDFVLFLMMWTTIITYLAILYQFTNMDDI